jgi:tRNA1(Val) A37 N6-methylase TrmN6
MQSWHGGGPMLDERKHMNRYVLVEIEAENPEQAAKNIKYVMDNATWLAPHNPTIRTADVSDIVNETEHTGHQAKRMMERLS